MGQYYNACMIDADGKILMWMHPYNYRNGAKLTEHSIVGNPFVNTFEFALSPGQRFHKTRVVWAGDYADPEEGTDSNLHQMCDEYTMVVCKTKSTREFPFLVNHTKKLYVKCHKFLNGQLHPLPILTAEGNGRGGGDYKSDSPLVGSWARDILSIEKEAPEGFEDLPFTLTLGDQ
jgi:hypothetical protein